MEKIDIHYKKNSLEKTLAKLKKDLKKKNYELIKDFLNDLQLGLVSSCEVSERGVLKVLFELKISALYFDKKNIRLTDITQAQMKEYIMDLQTNKVKKQKSNQKNPYYSEKVKSGIKKEIKRFLRYKWGPTEKWQKTCGWITTRCPKKSINYIKQKEVKKLLLHSKSLRDRVMIQVLFDGGMRIEECLNIRWDNLDIDEESNLYVIDLKEEFSKTKGRRVFLYQSETNELLKEWLETNKGEDPNKPIFKTSYNAFNKALKILSKKAIGREITPHVLRRGSATAMASELSHGQLCSRYGWRQGSGVPAVYIESSGVEQRKTAKKIKNEQVGQFKERLAELEKQNRILKQEIIGFEERLGEMLGKVLTQIKQSQQEEVLQIIQEF